MKMLSNHVQQMQQLIRENRDADEELFAFRLVTALEGRQIVEQDERLKSERIGAIQRGVREGVSAALPILLIILLVGVMVGAVVQQITYARTSADVVCAPIVEEQTRELEQTALHATETARKCREDKDIVAKAAEACGRLKEEP